MTSLAPEAAAAGQEHDDLTHVVCVCNPDVALCGTDVTDSDWATAEEETTCVVCADVVVDPCPRCGR